MKKIKLTQGQYTLVNNLDYKFLNQWKWCVQWSDNTRSFYAVRTIWIGDKTKTIRMARLILGAKKGQIVDHINHDTLDNRRKNLRICNHSENMQNRRRKRNSTSGYKGVSWNNVMNQWQAQIRVNGKLINLGFSKSKRTMAKTYDVYAIKLFGKFAHINFNHSTKS